VASKAIEFGEKKREIRVITPLKVIQGYLYGNRHFCGFEPPFGDLGATFDDYLRLIGKRVVDVLVLIELFSLGVTAESLRAIVGAKSASSLQRGPVDPKFHVEGVAPTNHSFSQKTMLNVLSYSIKYGLIFLPFCHSSRV